MWLWNRAIRKLLETFPILSLIPNVPLSSRNGWLQCPPCVLLCRNKKWTSVYSVDVDKELDTTSWLNNNNKSHPGSGTCPSLSPEPCRPQGPGTCNQRREGARSTWIFTSSANEQLRTNLILSGSRCERDTDRLWAFGSVCVLVTCAIMGTLALHTSAVVLESVKSVFRSFVI